MRNSKLSILNYQFACCCLLLSVNCFLFSSCGVGKKITETISYDTDSTKHVFSLQGKKNKLVKEVTYYPNDRLKSEYNFSDSLLNGPFKTFSETGKPTAEGAYENGVESGWFKYFDTYGVLNFEGTLRSGKKEGKWTSWYDEVQKKEEIEYSSDMLNGKWTHWFIDGNLEREEFYENGKKIREQVYE